MVHHHASALTIAILAALVWLGGCIPARAEVACVPLAALTISLAEKWHEAPVAHAIDDSGVMLIVFAAPGGATWTLVGVQPSSPAKGCVIGSGADWRTAPLPDKPGSPL